MADRATMFSQIAHDLPEDPPDVRSNWDALNDSLWGGLVELERPHVAIFWLHANILLACDAEALYMALDVFRQVADDLDQSANLPHVELRIFLIGTGGSFKPFSAQPPFREKY